MKKTDKHCPACVYTTEKKTRASNLEIYYNVATDYPNNNDTHLEKKKPAPSHKYFYVYEEKINTSMILVSHVFN